MSFSGLEEAASFALVSSNADGTFTLVLKRSQVTSENAKDYVLKVSYGDTYASEILAEQISIKVTFKDHS